MTAALCVLLALLPWFEGGGDPIGLFLTHTLVLAMLGAALVRAAARGRIELRAGWEAIAGAALAGACAVSFLRVDYRFGSFLTLWNVIVACLLCAVLAIEPPRRPRRLAQAAALSAAAQAVLGLVTPPVPNMTPSASFANASQLAAFLAIGVLLAAGLALECRRGGDGSARRWGPVLWATVAAVDAAALLRIGSRGALLSLLAAGVLWAILTPPRGRRWRVALAAAGVALAALAAIAVSSRFERVVDPYRFDRVRIWEASMRAASDHPLTGMGPGMFSRRGASYNFPQEEAMFRWSKTPGSTHSVWIEALVETGVPGLIAAILFALLLARRSWVVARRAEDPLALGIVLALIACLLQGVADTPFDAPAITLTLLALAWPLASPRSLPEAAWGARWTWDPRSPRPRAAVACVLAAIVFAHAAAVGMPYAAHVVYRSAQERADPARAVSLACRLDPWNPLYPATRAGMIAARPAPLDPEALARSHIDLRTAHRLDPGNPDHLVALGRLHARACFDLACDEAAVARAEAHYRMAIALGRKDPRPHAELAAFLLSIGRPAAGAALLEEAVALEPRFAMGWLMLGQARFLLGDQAAGMRALAGVTRAQKDLAGYVARNGYERDLMRMDEARLEQVQRRTGQAPGG